MRVAHAGDHDPSWRDRGLGGKIRYETEEKENIDPLWQRGCLRRDVARGWSHSRGPGGGAVQRERIWERGKEAGLETGNRGFVQR